MKKKIISIMLMLCIGFVFSAEKPKVTATEEDYKIFEAYQEYIKPFCKLPINERIIKTAEFFFDAPYTGATLEMEPEHLVVNLREFDCSTLVDTCFALALASKKKPPTWDKFTKELATIRYRNGKINEYPSRLHYSSEWMQDNIKKGLLSDVCKNLKTPQLPITLDFMSTHPNSYPALKDNPDFVQQIAELEKKISASTFFYIPKEEIDNYASKIQDGDILFLTTNIKGLDVTHAILAFKNNDVLSFIHASSKGKKVMLQEGSLSEYLLPRKINTGILVARPK